MTIDTPSHIVQLNNVENQKTCLKSMLNILYVYYLQGVISKYRWANFSFPNAILLNFIFV